MVKWTRENSFLQNNFGMDIIFIYKINKSQLIIVDMLAKQDSFKNNFENELIFFSGCVVL